MGFDEFGEVVVVGAEGEVAGLVAAAGAVDAEAGLFVDVRRHVAEEDFVHLQPAGPGVERA